MAYEIRSLRQEDEWEFCRCLESWSEEMKEAGSHKERWLERMRGANLGVKLAVTDEGQYAGMIQYHPARFSAAEADFEGAWFIPCIWVHGHKKGQGNFQGHGIGTALLQAAEDDIASRGGRAILAWGLTLPFWMKSKWYKEHGYVGVQRENSRELVIKSLDGETYGARWRKTGDVPPARDAEGRLQVTTFLNGACPVAAIAHERLLKAIGNQDVSVELIDSSRSENLEKWGWSDVLFIGKTKVVPGPPPSAARLGRILKRELRALKNRKVRTGRHQKPR